VRHNWIALASLVENSADRFQDLEVPLFVPTANVISLTGLASMKNGANCLAMVFHIQPIAHVQPITVDRQRLSRARIQNDERNQFLRKLIWPVIVRTVGRERR